jgi:hypothetical protein
MEDRCGQVLLDRRRNSLAIVDIRIGAKRLVVP